MKRTLTAVTALAAAFASLFVPVGPPAHAQTPVAAGAGSYASTVPMSGAPGDSTYYGPSFSQLESLYSTLYIDPSLKGAAIPTNHWWTDLLTSFRTGSTSGTFVQTPYSDTLWVFPYAFAPTSDGMQIYYPTGWFPRGAGGVVSGMIEGPDLQVDAVTSSGAAFSAPNPVIKSYGDWNISYSETDSTSGASITTYLARGVPFVWANYSGANPKIMTSGNTLLDGNGNAISTSSGSFTASDFAVSIGGKTFGVYTGASTTFNVSGNYVVPQLGSTGYVVYALLPNASYLNEFGNYAYAEVTGSQMNWTYNRPNGSVDTTWALTTTPLQGTNTSTLQGWLPHHYHSTVNNLVFKPYTYVTARGTMQVSPGSTFQISWPFHGFAPMLPAPHTNGLPNDYQASRMQQYMSTFAGGNRPGYVAETYGQGKELGITATYLTMADQLGLTSTKSTLTSNMETLLDNWYSYTPGKSAAYFGELPDWGALIGLPESYGSGDFNDQHFHYGYFMVATALTGMEDPNWLQNYGPMASLVAKEYANWDRTDTSFPFLRVFDVWEGHSWAGGFSSAGGENQESSSEAMDAWVGLFLLGNMMGNQQMADAGAMGYAMESSAVNEYWQDWKHTNFPSTYGLYGCAILASQQIQYQNFFSADPFWEYAIEYTPVNSWNNYLTRDPYFIRDNLAAILPERAYAAQHTLSGFTLGDANNDYSVEGNYPGDYVLGVQALSNQNMTATEFDNYWNANLNITTLADLPGVVYYLTHSLRALGNQDPTYYTDLPTSAVYYNASTGVRTAVLYNPQSTAVTANIYNNGTLVTSISVPSRQLTTSTVTGPETPTPLPPTGLTGTGTNGQIALSWTAASNATSYDVYRVSSFGSQFFSGITGTGFTDTGLVNGGTAYTYQVYSVDAAGMSQPCTPITLRLYGTGPQTIVDNLNDLSLVSSQSANWAIDTSNPTFFDGDTARADRSADDSEYLDYSFPNITNFTARVYTLNASTSELLFYTSVDGGNTFQPVAVNYGTRTANASGWGYYDISPSSALPANVTDVKIVFNSGSGNSWDPQLAKVTLVYNGPAGGTSTGPVPAAPTGVTAAPGNAIVNLAWNAVSGATSYDVFRSTTSGGEGIVPLATGITGTAYTSAALANGITYYYTIAAVNNNGISAQSTEVSTAPTTGVTPPVAPTGLTGTPINHGANLSWTASTGASSYEVFRGTSAGGEGATPIAGGITATTYNDTSLTNGSTYYYFVEATNAGGASPASNEVSVVPNAPTETPYGGTPWPIPGTVQAENYDTGGQSTAYNVTAINGSANNYRTDGVDLEATTDSGGGYDLGWSAAGQWFNYTVNVTTAGTYTVSIRAASGQSGGGTLHIADLNGDNLTGPISVPDTGGWQNWITVTGSITLAAGTQVLQVYQDTSGYNINWFSIGTGTVVTGPSAPTNLAATAGNASVSLTWTAGSGATSYNIYRGTTAGGESTTAIGTSTGTTYTDSTAANGTTYYYTVAAVNSAGTSGASNEVSATPSASNTVTDPLNNWNIISSKSANWTLDSSNPTFFNGDTSRATRTADDAEYLIYNFSGITSFNALVYTYQGPISVVTFYSSPDGSTWTQIPVTDGTESALVSGWGSYNIVPSGSIPSGTNYLKVQFASGTGNAWDPQLSQITINYGGSGGTGPTAPTPPTGLTATAGNASVGLTWTAATGATSYNVYRGTTAGGESTTPIGTSTGTTYTDSTAANGTTYYYTVAAVNSAGTSGASNEASATPAAGSSTTSGPVSIDCGGPVAGSFIADADFSGGTAGSTASTVATTYTSNPPPAQAVLQSWRTGVFTYTLPGFAPNTSATVALFFVEPTATAAGQRQFNVSINGKTVLTNFDIYSATGGQFTAIQENLGATTDANGQIAIAFTNGAAGSPIVEAISVNGTAGSGGGNTPPNAPTNLTATGGNTAVALSWTGSTGATSYNLYRGAAAGAEGATPYKSGLTGTTYSDTAVTNGTTYYYEVTAVDSAGESQKSNEASATPTAPATEGPYGGTPWAIPGTVQFENYDTGGENVGYSDTTPGNSGGAYRNDDVDIEATSDTGGGYDIGWTANGEWLKYTVNVATAGTYNIGFRVSSAGAGGTFHLEDANGNNLTGEVTAPGTGGWQTWTTVNATATLTAGVQTLKFVEDNADYNLNWMSFSNGTPPPGAPTGLTARGGNGQVVLNWTGSTGATTYNVYRATTEGGEGSTPYQTGITGTTYTDTGVTNGVAYYYTVTAVGPGGESLGSNEADAVPLVDSTNGLAIDCAGPAVGNFVADVDFSGGTVAAPVADAIDTSAVTNPAPQAVYQSQRYGAMTYTIPGLAPGAAYTVRLHLAETYWSAAGSREFNVAVNGTQALSNFDIYAAAGAKDKAIVESIPATADANGNIAIVFTNVKDNASVGGIEIDPAYTDTTSSLTITRSGIVPILPGPAGGYQILTVKNTGSTSISGPIELVLTGLPSGVTVTNPAGTFKGNPYVTATTGSLAPGASVQVRVNYSNPSNQHFTYGITAYTGAL